MSPPTVTIARGTMIGLPSGIYAEGAGHAIWFLGYILLAYPLGYFIAPLIWRAAVRHDAMTIPDVFGRHLRSRTLELVTAGSLLVALVPWGQYQFIGLQVVLTELGLSITPVQAVILAAVMAFLYLAVSGVRSPAFVALLKDAFMLVGIVAAGLAAVLAAGGTSETFNAAEVPHDMVTISGSPLVFAISTIIFQSITFYLGFSAAFIFTAKSERAIKSSTVWMPMYMLMYPFLVAVSFYAVTAYPGKSPNSIFMVAATDLLPEWLVGVVAAAALTITGSTLMLTVLNLTYYLLGQLVPGWLAVLFCRKIQGWAVAAGMIAGIVASVVLYVTDPGLGGINSGLIAVGINAAIMFGLSYLRPGGEREPASHMAVGSASERAAEQGTPAESGSVSRERSPAESSTELL